MSKEKASVLPGLPSDRELTVPVQQPEYPCLTRFRFRTPVDAHEAFFIPLRFFMETVDKDARLHFHHQFGAPVKCATSLGDYTYRIIQDLTLAARMVPPDPDAEREYDEASYATQYAIMLVATMVFTPAHDTLITELFMAINGRSEPAPGMGPSAPALPPPPGRKSKSGSGSRRPAAPQDLTQKSDVVAAMAGAGTGAGGGGGGGGAADGLPGLDTGAPVESMDTIMSVMSTMLAASGSAGAVSEPTVVMMALQHAKHIIYPVSRAREFTVAHQCGRATSEVIPFHVLVGDSSRPDPDCLPVPILNNMGDVAESRRNQTFGVLWPYLTITMDGSYGSRTCTFSAKFLERGVVGKIRVNGHDVPYRPPDISRENLFRLFFQRWRAWRLASLCASGSMGESAPVPVSEKRGAAPTGLPLPTFSETGGVVFPPGSDLVFDAKTNTLTTPVMTLLQGALWALATQADDSMNEVMFPCPLSYQLRIMPICQERPFYKPETPAGDGRGGGGGGDGDDEDDDDDDASGASGSTATRYMDVFMTADTIFANCDLKHKAKELEPLERSTFKAQTCLRVPNFANLV
jgi:hypothetical protein